VGGTNHGCFLRFDLGGTPRLTSLSTPVVQPGGLLRLTGHGIDGGLKGVAMVEGRLQQDASGTILGCFSRDEDQNGDPAQDLKHNPTPTPIPSASLTDPHPYPYPYPYPYHSEL
jgi:hypothetical protein